MAVHTKRHRANVDLLLRCVALLRQQTPSNLIAVVDKPGKKVTVTAQGLDRVDVLLDGHPAGSSAAIRDGATVVVSFTSSNKLVEAVGFKSGEVRQRRRSILK